MSDRQLGGPRQIAPGIEDGSAEFEREQRIASRGRVEAAQDGIREGNAEPIDEERAQRGETER